MARLRIAAGAALLCVLALRLGHAADPADSSGRIPPSWSAYAAQVSLRLSEDLNDTGNAAAMRLQGFLEQQAAKAPRAKAPALILRLWFESDGRIARVESDSLGDAQADRDLREVLLLRPIGTPPPRDLRQPLVIRLRLATAS
jgi:hypothetical protein